jgi:hypothetical protein
MSIPLSEVPIDIATVAEQVGVDPTSWFHNCHKASLDIVKSGLIPGARVARGTADGVGGQHSWVVYPGLNEAPEGDFSTEVYSKSSRVFDPTLWSYSEEIGGGLHARNLTRHFPHGSKGNVMEFGRPMDPRTEIIELTPKFELSPTARWWLKDMLGPLDRDGWAIVAATPVGNGRDWPAGEIFAAMDDTPRVSALIPIDVLGMTTRRNPSGLYLKENS